MKIAFIMDPLDKVKAYKDTTYFLMLAAHDRGHEVYYLDHRDILIHDQRVMSRVNRVDVHADIDKPFTIHPQIFLDLGEMDLVFVRTDPPVDRTYTYMTLLLDLLPDTTRVINRPSAIRDWNEKLAALMYASFAPISLIARRADDIVSFLNEHGRIVLKPLDGHGGEGILFLSKGDKNIEQSIGEITHQQSRWIKVQKYLPQAADGDKRILLLHGEPLGGILRLHADGVELNNLDAGGTAHPAELDECDLEICAAIKEGLIENGVVFSGIDVIGGKLIEINVTSPTGLQELCKFSGQDYHHEIIASLE
ncbi:MAG: glutathione synthase [Gammaproteobacteria bacterium]|nr:glutathione synthase [Gammaproteobacteria bacterium]